MTEYGSGYKYINGHGEGDGYGDGYNDGDGHGDGDCHGDGAVLYDHGDGYGNGDDNGYGGGNIDGYGDGHGDGYGYGINNGHGHCNSYSIGFKIDKIEKYIVRVLSPWPYIAVGCQTHSIEYWRENWQDIARREDIVLSQKDVDELLEKAEAL